MESEEKKETPEPVYEDDYYTDTGSFPLIGCTVTVAVIFVYAIIRYFFG